MATYALEKDKWPAMPGFFALFLDSALPVLQSDERILGLAVGGSLASGEADEYSDLDLVVVAESAHASDIMHSRQEIAKGLGRLLAAFSGEHVAEPRLLICLYGPPLLHVDLKFLALDEVSERLEEPLVLWDRNGQIVESLGRGSAEMPQPDLQWIEDRFWVWVHYGATKIARGELFEALGFLAFLRGEVLGPLALAIGEYPPFGIRKLESRLPQRQQAMIATVAAYDSRSCAEALLACADVYEQLRAELASPQLIRRDAAQDESLKYLARLLDDAPGSE